VSESAAEVIGFLHHQNAGGGTMKGIFKILSESFSESAAMNAGIVFQFLATSA